MSIDLQAPAVEILDVTPRHPSGRLRSSRSGRVELLAVFAAAVAATIGTTAPVGIDLADGVYRALFAGALVWFSARSRRTSWGLLIVGSSIAAATLVAQVLVAAALGVFGRSMYTRRRTALTGATIALCCLPSLYTQGAGPLWRITGGLVSDPFGTSAILTVLVSVATFRTGWRSISRRRRRTLRGRARKLLVAAALVIVASGAVCLAALPSMLSGLRLTQIAADHATSGDLDRAAIGFEDARSDWDRANRLVSGPWMLPARLLPVVGQNVRAAQVVTGQASALTESATEVTLRVRPDALVENGALNIDEIDAIAPAMNAFAATADRASQRISAANDPWLLPPIKERVTRAEEVLAPAAGVLGAAAEGLHVGRELLGGNEPSRVLVAIATPSEARASGGFVGSWVALRGEDGRVFVDEHYRSRTLNLLLEENDAQLNAGPDYTNRYGRFSIERHIQDVTMSPDFPSVAQVSADLFEQATGESVDAVLLIDPFVLQKLLGFTGPIDTGSVRLTANNAARELLFEQYVRFEDDENAREAMLESLTSTMAVRLLSEPPDPVSLAVELAPLAEQNRINLWLADDDGSTARQLGLSGEFTTGSQDTLALVHRTPAKTRSIPSSNARSTSKPSSISTRRS